MVGKADSNGSMSPTTTVWARCFAFLLSSSTRRPACNSVVHEQKRTVKNSANIGFSTGLGPVQTLDFS